MRVISGIYKGKKLEYEIEGTRPTMDRVKESVFGIIQNNIKNSVVLDLFAGSGSLGIEALSNGAKMCYFVDKSGSAIKIINNNLNGVDNYKVYKNDYVDFLSNCELKFDIIFLDPPYSLNLIQNCLNIIVKKNLLNDDGIIICEYENENFDICLDLIKDKKYGSKKIKIYKLKTY